MILEFWKKKLELEKILCRKYIDKIYIEMIGGN